MDTWNAGSAYFKRQVFKKVLSKDFRFEMHYTNITDCLDVRGVQNSNKLEPVYMEVGNPR